MKSSCKKEKSPYVHLELECAVLYVRKANALLARVGGLRIAADSFPLYGLREDQFLEMLSDFEAGIDVEHIFAVVQRF